MRLAGVAGAADRRGHRPGLRGLRPSDPDGSPGRRAAVHRPSRARPRGRRVTELELPQDIGSQDLSGAGSVFRNRSFVLLWVAQLLSQLASNMVLAALMATVVSATGSNTANAVLILTFLVPAVIFSTVAGVFVERSDARYIMLGANLLRAGGTVLFIFVGSHVGLILVINFFIATVTAFFAPAELTAMPAPRRSSQPDGGQLGLRPDRERHLRHRLRLLRATAADNRRRERRVRGRGGDVRAGRPGHRSAALRPPRARGGARHGDDGPRPARGDRPGAGGHPVRAQPSAHRLVAWLPGHRGQPDRGDGRHRPRLRDRHPGAQARGLLLHHGTRRTGSRDRHPVPERVRQGHPAPAGHRHRPGGDGHHPHRPGVGEAGHLGRGARPRHDREQPAGGAGAAACRSSRWSW